MKAEASPMVATLYRRAIGNELVVLLGHLAANLLCGRLPGDCVQLDRKTGTELSSVRGACA